MSYSEKSDIQLLEMYRLGDERAADIIIERYKEPVRIKAREFFLTGGDAEDLVQEGMIGLFEAIRDYKSNKNTSFNTFANLCIKRRLIKAVASDNTLKNTPLNNSVSFDLNEDDRADRLLNPENIFFGKEEIRSRITNIKKLLSSFEKKVFDEFLKGKNYTEIALALNKSPKSIDNAISRIRMKAKDIM